MSRWPRGIDAQYREHESNERMKRILALDVRYGNCAPRSEPVVIVDRDPGDEDTERHDG